MKTTWKTRYMWIASHGGRVPYIFGLSQYFSLLWNLMTLVINILVHIHFCGHSQQQKNIKQVIGIFSDSKKYLYPNTGGFFTYTVYPPLLLEIQKCSTHQFRQAFQLTSSFHLWSFLNIFKPENTATWKNVTYVFSLLKSRTNNSCCLNSSPINSHFFQALKIPTYSVWTSLSAEFWNSASNVGNDNLWNYSLCLPSDAIEILDVSYVLNVKLGGWLILSPFLLWLFEWNVIDKYW